MKTYPFFATTPRAMENILADELRMLGVENIKPALAGAAFQGALETAYRICLWSRIANRVLLELSAFPVKTQQDLYDGVYQINWFEHMDPDDSFAVSFSAKRSPVIKNSHFGALKVKDAIVDQMRQQFNKRPAIDTQHSDCRISVYLNGETAQLSLDLSGESLHRRGYRDISIKAPIKENLAAAMLLRSNWLEIAQQGGTLLDPMCGSGTLLLEGALIAADIAPGLMRKHYGFLSWKNHDPACWQQLLDDAEKRKIQGLEKLPPIIGFDQSRNSINAALVHIKNAGLQHKIHVEKREIVDARPAESWQPGLLICNPPYGERLGSGRETAELYQIFGEILKAHFRGWQASMIISDPELGFRLGVRSQKPVTLYNGAIACKLLRMKIEQAAFFIPKARNRVQPVQQISADPAATGDHSGAEMFANRLQKNLKKLNKWARRHQINCYRLYDADLPEFAIAVDIYQGEQTWVNVQEYEAPKTVDRQKADRRLAGALAVIPDILGVDKNQVFLKIRRRQKSTGQYEKLSEQRHFHVVEENGCRLLVNFNDYLDTGLFLDHRPLRLMIQQQAKGRRFLNLFGYTGSATVHAAMGGAFSTTSVDMSRTYLDWTANNLQLNALQGPHEMIRADCLEWLKQEAGIPRPRQYGLILLDPPTFSNSKRMQQAFDVQQDHVNLIETAAKLLAPGGILYFSTNFRRFKIDEVALSHLKLQDISQATIPEDFSRNRKIHYCWKIKKCSNH